MGLDFFQARNRSAILFRLELSHRLAELLCSQGVLALFETSPAPHANKQQNDNRNGNVNYNTMLLIGFKGAFGGGLKPIGLPEFLASQSLAGRRHYFAGERVKKQPEKLSRGEKLLLILEVFGAHFFKNLSPLFFGNVGDILDGGFFGFFALLQDTGSFQNRLGNIDRALGAQSQRDRIAGARIDDQLSSANVDMNQSV